MTSRQAAPADTSSGSVSASQSCEVWFADLGRSLDALEDEERRCPRLSPDELLRAERMGDLDQRRLWRASHIALRDILERSFGPTLRRVPFTYKAGGRPELAPELLSGVANAAVTFSLSHTAEVALIAISRAGPVGVDIEAIHARAFPDDRRRKVEVIAVGIAGGRPLPDDPDRRFLQAWTRIEALSKADGRGVLHTLSSHESWSKDTAGAREVAGSGSALLQFEVRDLDVGAVYCACVAGTGLPDQLPVKTYISPQNEP